MFIFYFSVNNKMYDEIFHDFKIVKNHCINNGNIRFEESAVFELLENLFPQYGSSHAVQIVIEMLDAQRIRDCKESQNESSFQFLYSDKSNDTNSIIEIEVPDKNYPIIDLTNASPELNETLIIEQSSDENLDSKIESDLDSDIENHDSDTSDNDYHGFNDSYHWKPFNDDWNRTTTDVVRFNNAPPLLECLALMGESHRSNNFEINQSNSSIAEVSEMLEENNNDPNNNLDETIFEEESIHISNTQRMSIKHDIINLNSCNSIVEEVFDPVPGCSKDTGIQ
jgi:hypothetical protein